MPSEKLFTYLFLAGLLVQEIIRFPHRIRNKDATRSGQYVDDRSHGVELWMSLVAWAGIDIFPLVLGFTDWLDGLNYRLPAALGWLGLVVLALSTWLLWRAHVDLGRNWSPTLQVIRENRLVINGIYAHLRHPIYASMWLYAIAQALMLWNVVAGWSGLAAVLLVNLVRIPREEQMMLEHYGDEYRQYMQQVGGLLPKL